MTKNVEIIKKILNVSKDTVIHIVGETVVRKHWYSTKPFDKTYVAKFQNNY